MSLAAQPELQGGGPRSTPSPCPVTDVRSAWGVTFESVKAETVQLALETPLRRVLKALHNELAQRGLGELLETPPGLYLSPGLEAGVPPLLEPGFFAAGGTGWRLAAYQPHQQDRSPALVGYHPTHRLTFVCNLKGAGIRSPAKSFVTRSGRFPHYQDTFGQNPLGAGSAKPHKPIDVLIGHGRDEWRSHRLIGGAQLLPVFFEVRHALSWHRLLYHLDGKAAATCVPVRVWRLREVNVGSRGGSSPGRRALPVEEYLTHPELMTPAQLAQVAADINPLVYLVNPAGLVKTARLRRRLKRDPETLGGESQAALRRSVGRLYLKEKGPVVYENLTRGKLRIGHVWDQVASDAEVQERLSELKLDSTTDGVRRLLVAVMTEVYGANRQTLCDVEPRRLDLSHRRGRFAYLKALYGANGPAARSVMEAVGQRAGRTLGALHGAGGHCLGRRLKVRDRWGRPLYDDAGLVLRMGAPGGGSAAKRNVTVCGELVDTAHLFNPEFDLGARLARLLSQIRAGLCRWASRRHLRTFQRCDLELAEESMVLLSALLTGDPGLVPEGLVKIDALRSRRKALEDRLRANASSSADQALKLKEIEALESTIGQLRRRLPPYGENLTLVRFRQAYRDYSSRARAAFRSPGVGR